MLKRETRRCEWIVGFYCLGVESWKTGEKYEWAVLLVEMG